MATKLFSLCFRWFGKCHIKSLFVCFKRNEPENPRATERGTELNAAHAQLLKKLRPIAFTETCRFLTTQSLEFQEICPKNSLETT